MSRPLHVLIVEDRPEDAELVLRELGRAGFSPDWRRVDTEEDFIAALEPPPEIILSDFDMPTFSGFRALEVLGERSVEIPFILISGTIGEDMAVAAMKQGAADYLLKDRLTRLGPAVDHALEQTRALRERKQAADSLRLFRTLVDHSSDAFEVIDPHTGRFLDVNEKGCADLGHTRAEYLSLHVPDIDPGVTDRSWRKWVQRIRRDVSVTAEASRRRKDGTTFPVELNAKWISLDRDYIVTVVRDITERKRTEERFRRLVDSNAQGVMFRKSSGEITGANDAFLDIVGYTRDDLDAGLLNWIALTPPEFAELDARCLGELADKGVCTPCEKEYVRKDGARVPVLVGAAAFEYDPREGVCFVLNLTEARKLEQQFLRAQRMESIGTLAGGIAHDLNNILSPILMSIELLKMKCTDSRSKDLIDMIAGSANRGADMVRQVLSFARGVEGRRMEVQVRHLLQDIEKIANDTFFKSIRVELCAPHDLMTVAGDPTQLHQVLLNLCVNARDAMPGGGMLRLSAENVVLDTNYAGMDPDATAGPHVLLQIADTGSGMSPQVMEKIFDPFFTTKEIGKGTGLGLSTSLAIIKSHGGFIRVGSVPGEGTTFRVYLPAGAGTLSATASGEVAALPHGLGEWILVVDDEASVREITRQTLEAFGYRVLLASDGAEAVSLYAAHEKQIAAALIDMMMPVMDGTATIQVLRRINPTVRVIATSGLAGPARLHGDGRFLPKPYTAETLLTALRDLLAV